MLRRVPRLRGLNLRQSPINRPPEFARDLRNLEYTSRGELDLRWGYEEAVTDGTETGIIDLFEYVGGQNDPNRGSLYALKSDGLYKLNGTTLEAVPEGNTSASQPTWTAQTKPVEYNKVLYWNDPDGEVDLWKFDGYSSYRAGCPKPVITSPTYSGTAGTYYFRFFLTYTDPQGNITWSDYTQLEGTNENIDFTIQSITHSDFAGFYQKYGFISGGGVTFYINSSSRTLTVDSHNYLVGDWVALQVFSAVSGPSEPYFIMVQIESIAANSGDPTKDDITFTAASIGSFVGGVATTTNTSLENRWSLRMFRSTLPDSGYEEVTLLARESGTLTGYDTDSFLQAEDTTWNPISSTAVSPVLPLNLVYDDTLIRVLPPKGKYLALYNEQMFIGNLGKDQPDFGYAQLLGNDTRLEDSIVWSDIPTLSNGSSVETFLVNNIRSIGESSDGSITAIHGNDDSFVVHKEKQSFYVNGDFITNSLRVRRAMSEQNGAASHRSIKDVEGGHLYATPKGIFLAAGGNKPVELSDIIEPLFTNDALSLGTLLLSQAKSVNDFLREKIYIYIPIDGSSTGVLLVYDYYYKEWLLHDNIPADAGFQDVGVDSTELYFATSTKLYKRTLNTKTDDASGINGYYWTGWFDLDAPSIVKKFQNLIILSITRAWNATIKAYCNWDSSTVEAQNTLAFTSTQQVMDTQVFQNQAYAVSFRISNESDQSDMLLTSYEVQVEGTQTMPKGDL